MNKRVSQFAHRMNGDGENVIFFNSVYRKCIAFDKKRMGSVGNNDFSDEEIRYLEKIHYYCSEDEEKKIINDSQLNYEGNLNNIEVIYIVVTNNCNMCCDYCLVKRQAGSERITKEVFDIFFDKIMNYSNNNNRQLKFIIYGGEPLLEINTVKYIIGKLRIIKKSTIGLITNGTLLTPEFVDYLANNKVYLNVSVDGPATITNAHRKFKYNRNIDVYNHISNQIKNLLKNYDLDKIALSITLSEETIKEKTVFLKWVSTIGIKKIVFNLLRDFEKTTNENYFDDAADFLIDTYDALKAMNIEEGLMDEFLFYFSKSGVKMAQCAAMAGTEVSLAPDGKIYSCHGYNFKSSYISSVEEDFISIFESIDNEDKKKFLPIYNRECYKCESFGVCGGFCYHVNKGNGYCNFIKKVTRWAVQRSIMNG